MNTILESVRDGIEADPRDVVDRLPPLRPQWLGDPAFLQVHGLRYPYVAGEMATGIATTAMVKAMAGAGMLGFFGSAGLTPRRVEAALDELDIALGSQRAWGVNLIHSPAEPGQEDAVVDLLVRRNVRRVSASAFMKVTPGIVRYACTGLKRTAGGIERSNHLFAKISRPEVAVQFMSPAPQQMLKGLAAQGLLTPSECELAAHVPLAEDVTAEADSGGHTDNRALSVLLPVILACRDRAQSQHGYARSIRVGAAGGLGCPSAVAAAFQFGAAYVVTGTINQSAVEAGTSDAVKRLLSQASMADIMMAPAADMFELGVKVQVLKRGTMFGVRATKLHQVYSAHESLETIPAATRSQLEKDVFRCSLDEVWEQTRRYWQARDAREVSRAQREPRHKMALAFRWYLGNASRWAQSGEAGRELDYQVWCGPAIGAFNDWVRGSFLEDPAQRTVVQIARNLLEGAAVVTRGQQLRSCGVAVPPAAFDFRPRPL